MIIENSRGPFEIEVAFGLVSDAPVSPESSLAIQSDSSTILWLVRTSPNQTINQLKQPRSQPLITKQTDEIAETPTLTLSMIRF